MRVAVIGAGLIGQAWAMVFASGGKAVRLWDGDASALANAISLIRGQLEELQEQGLVDDADAAAERIVACASLEDALDGVAYVQENLPERVELKREIFATMDRLCAPDTVLASSTSSIPASSFTESLTQRERCLVAHPVNPPYLIPVVELCAAPWTSSEAIATARQLMLDVGQQPVTVHKELQGFVLNRLQGALLREAFRLVEMGAISVEDLDVTVKAGLGLRWAFMGPFETIDLNAPGGVDDYCQRYGEMYRSISEEQTDTSAWKPEVIAEITRQRRGLLPPEDLKQRRLWRDAKLMELARERREQSRSKTPA